MTLRAASDPAVPRQTIPIRLEWVELIDLVNVREGGEATNLRALAARHEAALDGRDLPAPSSGAASPARDP